jgi:hypothetical protein
MGVYLFKVGLFGMMLLFGVVAIFLGGVTGYAALSNGEMTYIVGHISTTVSRSADPAGFWRTLLLWSAVPVTAGAFAVWLGRRELKKL